MASPLDNLARRVEGDPFFLACPLERFARSEGLSEEALAAALGCSRDALRSVRLCRAPEPEAASFANDLARIAAAFGADADALAEAVRRGQALLHMSRGGSAAGTLLAARDGNAGPEADRPRGNRP